MSRLPTSRTPKTPARCRRRWTWWPSQLGHEYDLIIGGHRLKTEGKIKSFNPARPAQVVGVHQKAGAEHAEKAMAAALEAFETWSRTSVETRVSLLLNAAEIIRERKFEFCAWLTYEVGKNWAEADADVGETIDFLGVLRARGAAAGEGGDADSVAGRVQSADVYSAGRGRGDSAVEFSVRDYGGNDGGFDRHREHGDPEAVERFADDCGEVCRGAGRGGDAGRRGEFLSGIGRDVSAMRLWSIPKTRFIAFTGSQRCGSGDSRARGEAPAGTDLDQANDSGDGRQGFDPGVARMRIWMRRWMAWSRRRSDSAGRSARRVRARLSRRRCTTCSWSACARRWRS